MALARAVLTVAVETVVVVHARRGRHRGHSVGTRALRAAVLRAPALVVLGAGLSVQREAVRAAVVFAVLSGLAVRILHARVAQTGGARHALVLDRVAEQRVPAFDGVGAGRASCSHSWLAHSASAVVSGLVAQVLSAGLVGHAGCVSGGVVRTHPRRSAVAHTLLVAGAGVLSDEQGSARAAAAEGVLAALVLVIRAGVGSDADLDRTDATVAPVACLTHVVGSAGPCSHCQA